LTSELVTNAIIHAGTRVAVTLRVVGDSIRIAVVDESTDRPHPRSSPDHLGGGRGLMLVETLADSWGVSAEGDGKSVWFELATPVGR
jgi:anti-sigma regulatory factor (Ser/Thr protein kinase)